jgi:HlyD family secretion protein
MKKLFFVTAVISFVMIGCNGKGNEFDASGTFESDEVVVSTMSTGKILSLNIEEGSVLAKDSVVGFIDPSVLSLQKEEVEATIESLGQQTINAGPQISLLEKQFAVQQSQLDNLLHEKTRIENLLKLDAATGKQLDDINAQIDVVKRQMNVTRQQINVQENNTATQNRSILSNTKPLEKKIAQLNDLLQKTGVLNPIAGTVITKYAEAGEMVTAGKALYKIADLSELYLRAYVTGAQLPKIKLGPACKSDDR